MDKKLKAEKRMNSSRIVRRVKFYGFGKNDKYKSKPEVVCYWTKEGGCFVCWKPSPIQMKIKVLKYNIKYFFRRLRRWG